MVDELIDDFIDREAAEFVGQFPKLLSMYVMCALLGFDRGPAPAIRKWSDDFIESAARFHGGGRAIELQPSSPISTTT
jgi:cytochrome P450